MTITTDNVIVYGNTNNDRWEFNDWTDSIAMSLDANWSTEFVCDAYWEMEKEPMSVEYATQWGYRCPDGTNELIEISPKQDRCKLYITKLDVKVDSNNDGAITEDDDKIEDDPTKPGKYILVNENDNDNDGIPDYADGYNLNEYGGNYVSNSSELNFIPIKISIKELPIINDCTKIKISYDASDPSGVTRNGTYPDYTYNLPGTNSLRMWKQDGNITRNSATAKTDSNPGDYIEPGEYNPAWLGFTDEVREKTFYIEYVSDSLTSGAEQITVEVDSDGDTNYEADLIDTIQVSSTDLLLMWQTYGTNEPIDQNTNIGGGNRIFPGLLDPYDGANADKRRKVYVKAITSTGLAGVPIYFRWFDVDDPSAERLPIDNPALGEDNKGNGADLGTIPNYTDTNGEMIVEFTVSMQPGDNFRIFASLDSDQLDLMDQSKADTLVNLPEKVVYSQLLTVWRKLWIERDCMAAVATTGIEMNHVEGTPVSHVYNAGQTTVDLGQNFPIPFYDMNQFEGGRYVINGHPYDVVSSSGDIWPWNNKVILSGDASGEPLNTYKLYDDDNQNMYNSAYYCTLGKYSSAFEDAYIKTEYLPESYSDIVDFNLNLCSIEVTLGLGYNNQRDVTSSANFWACLVISCYQGDYNADNDPDDDVYGDGPCLRGVTPEDNNNACCIFLETINDIGDILGKVVAHEIGHSGGGEHEDGGLMADGGGNTDSFTEATISTFRSNSVWLTTH